MGRSYRLFYPDNRTVYSLSLSSEFRLRLIRLRLDNFVVVVVVCCQRRRRGVTLLYSVRLGPTRLHKPVARKLHANNARLN